MTCSSTLFVDDEVWDVIPDDGVVMGRLVDGQQLLCDEGNVLRIQPQLQGVLIGVLAQTRAMHTVRLHRAANDPVGQVVQLRLDKPAHGSAPSTDSRSTDSGNGFSDTYCMVCRRGTGVAPVPAPRGPICQASFRITI